MRPRAGTAVLTDSTDDQAHTSPEGLERAMKVFWCDRAVSSSSLRTLSARHAATVSCSCLTILR